jgi:carbon monoxide dehydrogenase subunit G
MAIDFQQTFRVAAPIETVWRFMLDPEAVVSCMPGAKLEEALDDRTFLGAWMVKVGAITARYQGRVRFVEVDEAQYAVRLEAEGQETGGGTAKGSLTSRLRSLPDGGTEVAAQASVELTGRIMQMGRGMIQGVSEQIFQQFENRARVRLEGGEDVAGSPAAAGGEEPFRILPVVLRVTWAAVVRFVRRLFRRPVS